MHLQAKAAVDMQGTAGVSKPEGYIADLERPGRQPRWLAEAVTDVQKPYNFLTEYGALALPNFIGRSVE